MSQMLLSLPLFYEKYKEWICSNPRQASDMEAILKWTSYVVAGRIRNSHTLAELIYCLSNLLVLHNDRIIIKFQEIGSPRKDELLKVWLTVLQYSEVFLEMSAESMWGVTGKWIMITIVQIFKFICRLSFIYYYKQSITDSPPIPPLPRNELGEAGNTANNEVTQILLESINATLSRSGKVLRKLDASPALHKRTWKMQKTKGVHKLSKLEGVELAAETIYICKPLMHLGSIACFGTNTWKPWILSFTIDSFSLYLYALQRNQDSKLGPYERLLISRRYISLLIYLLRSPFYEAYMRYLLESALHGTGKRIPLARFLINPILKYLPFWQSIYSYMWSN